MLVVIGMAVFVVGLVLIPAAHAYFLLPGASPRLKGWVSGETAGTMLTTIPAIGLIAMFYFLIDPNARDIGVLHIGATLAIAVIGGFVARSLIRFGARLEQAAADEAAAAGSAALHIPEKRAA